MVETWKFNLLHPSTEHRMLQSIYHFRWETEHKMDQKVNGANTKLKRTKTRDKRRKKKYKTIKHAYQHIQTKRPPKTDIHRIQ